LITQGKCLTAQHDYIQAQQVLQEAVALARQSQLAEKLCVALCYLGKAIGYTAGYDRASDHFQESLALVQRLSVPGVLSKVLTTWGEIELFHGHIEAARAHFQDVLAREAQQQTELEMLANAHYGLAHIALQEQDVGQAREHAAESARLFQQIGYYKASEVEAWIQALPAGGTPLPD
jgi:tetratricopeptide (TPR) repeat protein